MFMQESHFTGDLVSPYMRGLESLLTVLDARLSLFTSAAFDAMSRNKQHFGAELEKNNTTTVPLFPFYQRVFTFERLLLCFVIFFCLALLFFLCLYLKGIWSPAGSQKFSDMVFVQGRVLRLRWKMLQSSPIFNFLFCILFCLIYAGTFFLFLTVLLPCSSSKKSKKQTHIESCDI